MFNLKKLKEVEIKEQYHVEIAISFTALENLDDELLGKLLEILYKLQPRESRLLRTEEA
jgi:hypothetical protein